MTQQEQDQPSQEGKEQTNGPSKIASALRPLAKEVIKGGLLTFTALTDSLAGIGKQFTDMVDEAKAELAKKRHSS